MISVEYKILFEVKFLHDYYLYGLEPGGDGSAKSFFAMSEQNQSVRLAEQLKSGQYDIRRDLDAIIGVSDEKLINNLRMKFVKTATGFFVGMQVKRITSLNGEIRFQPVITPDEDTHITIGLSSVNPFFGSISNLRLEQNTDNIYFFSNENPHHPLSLASPISQIVPGQQYRMGDLAVVAGNVKQAIADNTGHAHLWRAIEGNGFINQGDFIPLSSQKEWYDPWRTTVRLRSQHPTGVIRIALVNKNKQFSLIDENRLLTNKFSSTIENGVHLNRRAAVHPVFELRYLSRSTYWRYRKKNGFSEDERSYLMNTASSILMSESDYFITKNPQPIIRDRSSKLWFGVSIRLPNAQPGAIRAEGGKVFSDIEFNELNPIHKGH